MQIVGAMIREENRIMTAEKKIDFEKSYIELKEWVLGLKPSCFNCVMPPDKCTGCGIESFHCWDCDPRRLPKPAIGEIDCYQPCLPEQDDPPLKPGEELPF